MKFKRLYEDARDAGYPHELYTPRLLDNKDYRFVAMNAGRPVGSEVMKYNGEFYVGLKSCKTTNEFFNILTMKLKKANCI